MKKRPLRLPLVLAAIIAVAALLPHEVAVQAQECRIIRILGMTTHKSIRAEPEILRVSKGSCVIWVNWSTAEVKVIFKEGKKCASVSEAPVGFSLDYEECFVTSWVPFGGTSSLRFKEAGVFEYEIEEAVGEVGEEGRKMGTGKITVY